MSGADANAAEPVDPALAAPRRRRRRWPIVVIVLVVIVALLAGALEILGRSVGENLVRDRVASALGVSPASDVDVAIGGGPLIPQLIGGRLTEVTATSDHVALAGLTARIRMVVSGVAISGDHRAREVSATVVVPDQAAMRALIGDDVDSAGLAGSRLVVTKKLSAFGVSIEAGLRLAASAEGGRVVLTPAEIQLGSATVPVAEAQSNPLYPLVKQYVQPHSFCVLDQLPAGLSLTSATISGGALHLAFSGRDVALSGSAKGRCS